MFDTSVGDFGDVIYQVVNSRFENDNDSMTVDEINAHLDDIVLKHVNHDPSKFFELL